MDYAAVAEGMDLIKWEDGTVELVEVQKIIKKEGKKFVLYSKDGKKKLGTHDSYGKAMAQERAIREDQKRKSRKK